MEINLLNKTISKKSIAIISTYAPSVISFKGNLICHLVNSGFNVYVLCPDYNIKIKNKVKKLKAKPIDIELERSGLNPFEDIYCCIKLVSTLKRIKVDYVLAYYCKSVVYGLIASYFANIKERFALIEGLGFAFTNDPNKFSFKRFILKRILLILYKISLLFAKKVFFLNRDDRDEFVKNNLIRKHKTKITGPIGLDLSKWKYSPYLEKEKIMFLFVGRFLKEKGLYEFAYAAKKIKKNFPQCEFVLLGSPDKNPGGISNEIIKSWESEGFINYPGFCEVLPWLKETSVFVLPSYREGFPRSTQEAMIVGRAVITTNVPGCRETVIEGKNGFLINPGDPIALEESMMKFVRDPKLIREMGYQSHIFAKDKFDSRLFNDVIVSQIT